MKTAALRPPKTADHAGAWPADRSCELENYFFFFAAFFFAGFFALVAFLAAALFVLVFVFFIMSKAPLVAIGTPHQFGLCLC